jgi:hypothetical protein
MWSLGCALTVALFGGPLVIYLATAVSPSVLTGKDYLEMAGAYCVTLLN